MGRWFIVALLPLLACNGDDDIAITETAFFTFSSSGTTVTFADQSDPTPTSWRWDFGGHGASTQRNPTFAFPGAGTFQVALSATFASGNEAEVVRAVVLRGDAAVSVVVTPTAAALGPGEAEVFTAVVSGAADTRVNWSATCGDIAGTGNTITYTAPTTTGVCTVTAISAADPARSASAVVTVEASGGPDVAVTVTPTTAALEPGDVGEFTAAVTGADTSVNWSATCGSIAATGNTIAYTAPATIGSCTVTATSAADPTKSASAIVTVEAIVGSKPAPSYIGIANVSLAPASGGARVVSFDVSWDESWRGPERPTWVAAPNNWDAAWVFVKYRVDGGAWRHATLAAGGHVVPSGAVVDVPDDRLGAFVYRASSGYGTFAANGLGLAWDYAADGVASAANVEVRPFGVEMVYVPQGVFSLGSGGWGAGEFREGGTWNTPFPVTGQAVIDLGDAPGQLMWTEGYYDSGSASGSTNAAFPTGYAAFYAMKYEVTQGQYVGFLNTLTQAQADARMHTGSGYRYAVYGSSVGSYVTSLPFVAMNYVSWVDGAAFTDWAALRPMTELEFEKAARGPLTPVPNEFAWGSTSITGATGLADARTSIETPTPVHANANYSMSGKSFSGPVRSGSFAVPGDSRRSAGAGYYGALELSGNLWEWTISVGHPVGRVWFVGEHGDGALTPNGNADVTSWPGDPGFGAGLRGGNHASAVELLLVSSRLTATLVFTFRPDYGGWRAARSAP